MPLYDVLCPGCGTVSEVLLASSVAPACPHCGSTEARRLVAGVAPPGKSKAMASAARARARREGHLSNF